MNKKILVYFTLGALLMGHSAYSDEKIKKPNVSGQFYDANPKQLSSQIEGFLSSANVKPFEGSVDVIITPHAGYIYSGAVAAYSFKAVSKHQYKTIIILAPSHFVGFDGISVWDTGGFQTPLGVVDVDKDFSLKLIGSHEKIYFHEEAFLREHSLEVEIPFLQKTFSDFKIVPIVMGQPSVETMQAFAQALNMIIGNREDVLIVVSTDLSHYHNDATARIMDERTIKTIERLDIASFIQGHQNKSMESCGFIPILTALLYAKERGLGQVDVLKYAHSGDVSGDMDRVVGYTSVIIRKFDKSRQIKKLTMEQKERLYSIAKEAIVNSVKNKKKINVHEDDPRLSEEEGAFVTITKGGQLRGCIGNILGSGPLYLTVRDMAIAAVSEDPRFKPVMKDELDSLEIEVSVLSKPWRVKSVDEIILGEHGVIISQGPLNRGLFLPEVATQWGFTKEEFLSRLCAEKAGLPADAWKDPKTQIEVFTTTKFSLHDLK